MLDLRRGVARGEDEPQVAVPVRERADPLAGRDRDRQPGDAGHGQGTVPALDVDIFAVAINWDHDQEPAEYFGPLLKPEYKELGEALEPTDEGSFGIYDHVVYDVPEGGKLAALRTLLDNRPPGVASSPHEHAQLAQALVVQSCGGLVEQQDVWLTRYRSNHL